MDFYFMVEGDEKINQNVIEIKKKEYIKKAEFIFDSPDDSEEKSSRMQAQLTIFGKLEEETVETAREMALWALKTSGETGVYRKIIFKSVAEGKVYREYSFSNAFVVDYSENYPEEGSGEFVLKIKQKRDKFNEITIEGDFEFEEDNPFNTSDE